MEKGHEPYESNMHVDGESDRFIVPAKRRNKGDREPADGVEGRERTKENIAQSNPFRTQCREDGCSRLDGVRQARLAVLLPALLPPFIRGRSRVR